MRERFILAIMIIWANLIFSQAINFANKKGLVSLLCGKTWIQHNINKDSTFSDKVVDSIKFYINGTFYMSARQGGEKIDEGFFHYSMITGTCVFNSTGKISKSDTATDYISIDMKYIKDDQHIIFYHFSLIDGYRIKGSKCGKISGNSGKPYVVSDCGCYCKTLIWR